MVIVKTILPRHTDKVGTVGRRYPTLRGVFALYSASMPCTARGT
ncbi:MAG TPA: hypothetical protein VJN19_11615 [Propionibacteriaceae bacterium]|nr:hypothetical protein [Propionibacteriaceae bacterium]